MATFNKKRIINSYTVDKLLIQNLEDYCKKDLLEIIGISNEQTETIESDFSITLHNSIEYEKYTSTKDYKYQNFRDDITGIDIEHSVDYTGSNLKIILKFDEEKEKSTLAITIFGSIGREKLISIEQSILALINSQRNLNKYWHINESLSAFSAVSVIISLLLIFSSDYSSQTKSIGILVLIAGLFYAATINFFKPYCTFDTNKQKHLDKWFTWLFTGVLGFIVFNTILFFLRKNIFGF